MRILLIGKTGQVGHYLQQFLPPLGELIAPDHAQMDLAKNDSIQAVIRQTKPDIIVNAAGTTDVDRAEREPDSTMQIDGIAPGLMAEEARGCGALLVHYSTTFVFNGNGCKPYEEEDAVDPINAYGCSKLYGERAIAATECDHLILRATWTYSDRRSNFPLAVFKLAREKKELAIVDDQVGAPTWARAYAKTTAELLKQPGRARECSGIYHLSSAGQTTRYGWAAKIIQLAQKYTGKTSGWPKLRPIASTEYPHGAPRPLYTVVSNGKIQSRFGIRMSGWDEQLEAFIQEWVARSPAHTG